ncbi:MAG: O-succinylbenzoic acid--CoA ligase [Ulvibacter sp.]
MKTTWQTLHPSFKLNGLHYESLDDLRSMANNLRKEGEEYEKSIGKFILKWLNNDDFIKVETSGSTGDSKKIKITKEHMVNSAQATGNYFNQGESTSALLCLSANYIAGKMMLVRAMVLGWDLHIVAPAKEALTEYDNDYDFVAMVPYQLYHAIPDLKKVKKLIVGGGPVSKELTEMLRDLPTEIYATYGMTETISHIAARRINGVGRTDIYETLPNVKLSTDDRGCLTIYAPGIDEEVIITNDLVDLISPSQFRWLGRYDNVINSGGYKIFPETVEEKLASFIELPFIIASEKDAELGERVILVIENSQKQPLPNYSNALAILESYERPKKIYTITKFPFTETEKIKRGDVLRLLRAHK